MPAHTILRQTHARKYIYRKMHGTRGVHVYLLRTAQVVVIIAFELATEYPRALVYMVVGGLDLYSLIH